jgi:hypothetical protein
VNGVKSPYTGMVRAYEAKYQIRKPGHRHDDRG